MARNAAGEPLSHDSMFALIIAVDRNGKDTNTSAEIVIPPNLTHSEVLAWLREKGSLNDHNRCAGIYEVR
jgi:hypothetical protein